MEYITVREAAEKWGVSERRIGQYCIEGRIHGVERFGGSWAIPVNAEKPGDPRKQKKQDTLHRPKPTPGLLPGFMPLMNTPFQPGHCMEAIERIAAGPKRDIALAEYHYFSGQAEKAMREAEAYWNGQEKRTPKLLYQATCLRFCVHRKRLTSGGRLSSLAVLRRRRL